MFVNSTLTIIVPVLNEVNAINSNAENIKSLNSRYELIFVDGGSTDGTLDLLQTLQCKIVKTASKGRGNQIAEGAKHANDNSNTLLFLHIDTQLPSDFAAEIQNSLNRFNWGRFDIKLNSSKFIFKLIAYMMNMRSKLTNIATGDQAIFVNKHIFLKYVDSVATFPIMEDIYMSQVLKSNHGPSAIIKQPVITSTRYWNKHGIYKTVINLWKFRLLYFFGMSPHKLYQLYYK